MAYNKKEEFSKADNALASFAKAISHPARIQILRELAAKTSCICGEIVSALPLAQSTVSQHLLELKKAGLVSGTVNGVRSCYCIDRTAYEEFRKKMDAFFGMTEAQPPKPGSKNGCC